MITTRRRASIETRSSNALGFAATQYRVKVTIETVAEDGSVVSTADASPQSGAGAWGSLRGECEWLERRINFGTDGALRSL